MLNFQHDRSYPPDNMHQPAEKIVKKITPFNETTHSFQQSDSDSDTDSETTDSEPDGDQQPLPQQGPVVQVQPDDHDESEPEEDPLNDIARLLQGLLTDNEEESQDDDEENTDVEDENHDAEDEQPILEENLQPQQEVQPVIQLPLYVPQRTAAVAARIRIESMTIKKKHTKLPQVDGQIITPQVTDEEISSHGQDSRSCLGLARLASLGLDHETETTLVKTTRLASYVAKVSKVS